MKIYLLFMSLIVSSVAVGKNGIFPSIEFGMSTKDFLSKPPCAIKQGRSESEYICEDFKPKFPEGADIVDSVFIFMNNKLFSIHISVTNNARAYFVGSQPEVYAFRQTISEATDKFGEPKEKPTLKEANQFDSGSSSRFAYLWTTKQIIFAVALERLNGRFATVIDFYQGPEKHSK